MTFEIRTIGVEEASAFAALCAETFRLAYADLHAPDDLDAYCAATYTAAKLEAVLRSTDHVCKMGFRDGAAGGFYVVRNAPCPIPLDGLSAELKQIYLLPREFGGGLGRALMDDAMGSIRALGAAHAWLAVADINKRGPPFYRKRGFETLGVGPTFEVGADRVKSTILSLRL